MRHGRDGVTAMIGVPVRRALALVLAAGGSLAAQATAPRDSSLQALVAARVAIGANPAIAALRITPAGVETAFAGDAKSPDGRPLGPRTLFEIGSITKAVTGTLLAEAIRRGEAREDERLVDVFPGLPLPKGGEVITLLDLATHRSGLESFPSGFVPRDAQDPWGAVDSAAVAAGWARSALRFAPGSRAEYSNVGAGMLGRALVSRAKARDYDALVQARVARPLGLRDFTSALTPERRARFATGHLRGGDTTAHWTIPYLAGAGAIVSSLADMQRLAEACLGRGPGELVAAITDAQRPRRDFQGPMKIGLHWIALPTPDSAVISWHNGGTGGFRSWMGCNRRTGRAAVVLTNSEVGVDDLGLHLVDPVLPLRPPTTPVRRTAIAVDTTTMDGLVGRYALAPTFAITVTREGTRLMAQATSQPAFELFAESAEKWFLKVVDAQVEFERGADGRVTALVLVQNGARQRGVRLP
jgi:CubicO group peptidase (beta-lactamase class C family)